MIAPEKIDDRIVSRETASALVAFWKEAGDKIVFTNGCFDIIHFGHVRYLERAKALGNRLIVGLNSDQSVKRLKGHERPVNDEQARAVVLASLRFSDAVVIFEEDTPLELIKTLKPDVLVKGGDYEIENIIGADFVLESGGKVEIIDFVEGYSSSKIIQKLKNIN